MKAIPFFRIACFCFLLVLMPVDAFSQVDIRDANNRIVCMNNEEVRNKFEVTE